MGEPLSTSLSHLQRTHTPSDRPSIINSSSSHPWRDPTLLRMKNRPVVSHTLTLRLHLLYLSSSLTSPLLKAWGIPMHQVTGSHLPPRAHLDSNASSYETRPSYPAYPPSHSSRTTDYAHQTVYGGSGQHEDEDYDSSQWVPAHQHPTHHYVGIPTNSLSTSSSVSSH